MKFRVTDKLRFEFISSYRAYVTYCDSFTDIMNDTIFCASPYHYFIYIYLKKNRSDEIYTEISGKSPQLSKISEENLLFRDNKGVSLLKFEDGDFEQIELFDS